MDEMLKNIVTVINIRVLISSMYIINTKFITNLFIHSNHPIVSSKFVKL